MTQNKLSEVELIKTHLALVECFNIKRDYYYLSTPITTGKKFYETLKKYNVKERKELPEGVYFKEVILENIFDAQKVCDSLQKRGLEKIINPAKFDEMKHILKMNPKWHQEVYMGLWEGVIMRFVKKIIFNEGWEYSSGAVQEWVISQNKNRIHGIETPVDLNEDIITQKNFEEKLNIAIKKIEKDGLNADKLRNSLEEAKKIYYN